MSPSKSKGQRRKSNEMRRSRSNELVESSPKRSYKSVLSIGLLSGVIFCLLNVAVILRHVDTHRQANSTAAGITTLPVDRSASLSFNKKQPKPQIKVHMQRREDQRNLLKSNYDRLLENELSKDKQPLLEILREAGVEDIDDDTLRELPTWTEVAQLYGDSPRIYGLDSCAAFQNSTDPAERFVSTAGTFNSGTNHMAELLIHNCHMPERMKKYGNVNRGVRWQVPWGKHNPPQDEEFRNSHKTKKDVNVTADTILPAVTIRDPYKWMQSMCRIHYKAYWPHIKVEEGGHCPNLVPDERDIAQFRSLRKKKSVPVRVQYPMFTTKHESLAHFWNEWYNEYKNADFPRVMVRFEDLIFHAKNVTYQVCKCAGGEPNKGPFHYVVNSAKKGVTAHGKMSDRTGLVDAMIRYGKDTTRLDGFTEADLEFAASHLDPELMEFFSYQNAPQDVLVM